MFYKVSLREEILGKGLKKVGHVGFWVFCGLG